MESVASLSRSLANGGDRDEDRSRSRISSLAMGTGIDLDPGMSIQMKRTGTTEELDHGGREGQRRL
jgi:hypothetical protein